MRIAILTETFLPQINGVVRTIEKVIRYLEDNGHEVLLIAFGEGESEIYSKSKVIRMPGLAVNVYKELSIIKSDNELLSKLYRNDVAQLIIAGFQSIVPTPNATIDKALHEFKPELIHLVTPATLCAAGQYFVDRQKLPCLATFHTDLASYAPRYKVPYGEQLVNFMNYMIYSRVDRVLAPSPSSKVQLEEIGLKSVGVFGRGVDNQLFKPDRASKEILTKFGLDPSLKTILYAGRLAEEKSISHIIKAFKNISKQYDCQLLLVGDGPMRKELEKSLNGTKHAFTGFQTGEDYADLHSVSDIFAFASITETFGQVVLEAMASKSAIVCYDSPGVRDLVQHQYSGLLTNPKSDTSKAPHALQAALMELLENPALAEQYSTNAYNEAQQRSWSKILGDFVSEYETLAQNHKAKLSKQI